MSLSSTSVASPDETAMFEEMVFSLAHHDQPTVAFVECASLAKRDEIEEQLAGRLSEYRFYTLDVTPYPVVSLLRVLQEKLPAEVQESQPVSYVVHVHGLENSLLVSEDGRLVASALTRQLNLERELLFREVSYIIVLWGDAQFFQTLRLEAPDLCHWVTYSFRFEDHTARSVESLPPLPPERLLQRGNIAERQQRIQELQDRYDHLNLDDSDKKRLLRDKVDILFLLAEEHVEAFQYIKAEEYYKVAIAIQNILNDNEYLLGGMLFSLANVCLLQGKTEDALHYYAISKPYIFKDFSGGFYFQLGMLCETELRWDDALDNYKKSIEADRAIGEYVELGEGNRRIGVIYTMLKKWSKALKYFNLALEWHQRIGDYHGLGLTHYSIGKLYYDQERLDLALIHYEDSVKWQLRSKNIFDIGSAYLQIGVVYEDKNMWDVAIDNYKDALRHMQDAGEDREIGGVYYQFGSVYKEKELYKEACIWLKKAVDSFAYHNNSFALYAKNLLKEIESRAE